MAGSTISGGRRRAGRTEEVDAGDPRLFTRRVITVVRRIPVGRVATYGDVAALAGRPTAWRAVGSIMRRCRTPGVPCHRVVGSGGRLGGYSDRHLKQHLLAAEGVQVTGTRLRHFARIRWHAPRLHAMMKPLEDSAP